MWQNKTEQNHTPSVGKSVRKGAPYAFWEEHKSVQILGGEFANYAEILNVHFVWFRNST